MASTYTPLGIEKMATGENAGTWGTKTNTNLEIIEQISGGYTAVNFASDANKALSVSDGSTGAELAHRVLEFTSSGSLTATRNCTIPLDVQQFYVLKNSTTGGQSITFKYVSGSGNSVTITNENMFGTDEIVFAVGGSTRRVKTNIRNLDKSMLDNLIIHISDYTDHINYGRKFNQTKANFDKYGIKYLIVFSNFSFVFFSIFILSLRLSSYLIGMLISSKLKVGNCLSSKLSLISLNFGK